jgi:hypothetical protein
MSDVKNAVDDELYGYLDLEAYARDREIDGAFSTVVVPDGVHVIWAGTKEARRWMTYTTVSSLICGPTNCATGTSCSARYVRPLMTRVP